MSERDERVEALAEVLAQHREDFSDHCCHWHDGCDCGWTDEPDGDSTHVAYVGHLAATLLRSPAMRDLLAEAWDEGHAAGCDYQGDGWNSDAHDPAEDNPYRQETA